MTQRLSFLAAVLLAAIAPRLAGGSPAVGTLPEDSLPGLKSILATAVQRSPSAISASIAVAQNEATRYSAAAGLWPSITGGGNYSGDTESIAGGTGSSTKGLFYNVGINQPIFQWGALKWNADIGKLSLKISEKNFGEAYRLLAVTLRSQYLALILQRIQVRNVSYQLKLAEESFAVAKANREAGAISDGELMNDRMSTEDARLAADRVAEDFRLSKLTFMRLAGLDQLSDESIPMEVPAPKYSAELADGILQHFLGGGIDGTFENQALRMQIQQDELHYKIARTNLFPKFSVGSTYNLANQQTANPGTPATANSPGAPGTVTQYALKEITYGVYGNWTIFDGFLTRAQKLSALASKRADERQRQTYIDSTIDAADSLRAGVGLTARREEMAETRANLVKAGVDLAEEDVKLGIRAPAGLESARLSYYQSEWARAGARAEYFNQWCSFVSLTDADPALENLPYRYVR